MTYVYFFYFFGATGIFRCFYSRNIGNLFMGGRNISCTHEALGTIRVSKILGMIGVVVGRAAWICKQKKCSPKQV